MLNQAGADGPKRCAVTVEDSREAQDEQDCPYDSAVSGAGDRSTGEPGLERVGALEWFTSAPAVPET